MSLLPEIHKVDILFPTTLMMVNRHVSLILVMVMVNDVMPYGYKIRTVMVCVVRMGMDPIKYRLAMMNCQVVDNLDSMNGGHSVYRKS